MVPGLIHAVVTKHIVVTKALVTTEEKVRRSAVTTALLVMANPSKVTLGTRDRMFPQLALAGCQVKSPGLGVNNIVGNDRLKAVVALPLPEELSCCGIMDANAGIL